MNLTKIDKAAFVRAVMADAIRAIWDDVSLRHFLNRDRYHSNPRGLSGHYTVCLRRDDISTEQNAQISKLAEESLAQRGARDNLGGVMASTIAPFRTLAAAKKGLPEELHKYLPADRDATGVANLPAVASPVDLLKAAGWPK